MTINTPNLLILVGAVHGIVLCVLLLFSSRNRRSGNVLLALMLAFYTLPLLKVTLHELGFFRSYSLWLGSVELLYGLGPSLYLYSKTVTDPAYRLTRVDLAHFLPVVCELAYYLSPLYGRHSMRSVLPAESATHLIWMLQQAGAVVSILVYFSLTHKLLWDYSRWVRSNYSDISKRNLRWLQTPIVLYTVFFVLWLGLRTLDVVRFSDNLSAPTYAPLLIFLSFSTYWIGTKGYLQAQPVTEGFSTAPRPTERQVPQSQQEEDVELDSLFDRLQALMADDKPYLQIDLSLSELAEHLEINPRQLSRLINTKARMNFYDFVSQYRVEEFKMRVRRPDAPRTLLDLAHDCGFGSKATFNHVFKKQTGLTPSQYKKRSVTDPPVATSRLAGTR